MQEYCMDLSWSRVDEERYIEGGGRGREGKTKRGRERERRREELQFVVRWYGIGGTAMGMGRRDQVDRRYGYVSRYATRLCSATRESIDRSKCCL